MVQADSEEDHGSFAEGVWQSWTLFVDPAALVHFHTARLPSVARLDVC